MKSNNNWTTIPMFCPNCGQLNYGYQNTEKKIKYECTRCGVVLVRTTKGRRHDTIEMYAAAETERLQLGM